MFGRAQQPPSLAPTTIKATDKGTDGRLRFEHEGEQPTGSPLSALSLQRVERRLHDGLYAGRTIYEWEQSLEEVNIYVKPPPG
jgi:hypothetical protein